MRLALFQIGKTSLNYINKGVEEYSKRINNYMPFELITLPDERYTKSQSIENLKIKEGKTIISKIKKTDYVILLDEKGKQFNSKEFSGFINNKIQISKQQIIFIIGGAYGFSDETYKIADEKIALSKMTFPHQLIRLIFLEQLYRAFTILNNEPYHH